MRLTRLHALCPGWGAPGRLASGPGRLLVWQWRQGTEGSGASLLCTTAPVAIQVLGHAGKPVLCYALTRSSLGLRA